MKHSRFVHLHLHTQYSLLDGAIRPKELFEEAKKLKMPAVAMTDHGNIFGAVEFYELGLKYGVKPIIGCEVYVAPASRTDRTPPKRGSAEETIAHHLVLLVKNIKGYKNLCKLLTTAYIEGFYYKPRIDKELLREHNEGLIALSACLHGEVSQNLNLGRAERAEAAAREYKEIFTNNRFFFEIQDNDLEEQKKVNKALVQLGKKLGIQPVATNDCHYLKRDDARYHDILLCIQTGKTFNDPNRMRFTGQSYYFKTPEEMEAAFTELPEAISNTIEIAERCNLELNLGEYHLPEFPLPKGETLETRLEKKSREGVEERLRHMKERGVDPESRKWKYYERLEKELKVIERMGFPGYFLIVADFIEHAKELGIPVGPGRGSAAGSLVAYALGITTLDPIRYNLLFERFLNPDRISLPDIDIDFCFEGRDDVIKYVADKYGPENVTQIITFGVMKARAVIRDVGRVLDMPYGEVDKIAKLIPNRLDITVGDALKEEPQLKKLTEDDGRVAELIDAARALEGLPRHASTHAAGVVISNKPLVEYLPLYKGPKDEITTQFPMAAVEKIGLVKFDFLGIKTITVIDRAVKEVRRNRGVELVIEDARLDDRATYELISNGNTNGVFQLESSGMKELLRKLQPENFEHLIAAVALYRPGPLQSGMVDDFIKGRHGKANIRFEVPELKAILENTYGVMVYQEQVMEIARVLAGFTPGEADVLRKAMGKKVPEVMLDQRARFLQGAKEKKVPPKKAEKIFDLMEHFAGYGFNKSHSAAYALIAFQTAYLKAHFPVEFMAALLSSNMGDSDKVMRYIGECRETGLLVKPPDVNESSMDFAVSGDSIRFGLAAVKNVGAAAIEAMIKAREEGEPYESLQDLLVRVDSRKVNKKVLESLIKSGAFDFTGRSRARLMASLEPEMELAQGAQRDRAIGQGSIFDVLPNDSGKEGNGNGNAPGVTVGPYTEWTEKEVLAFEKETLGFYISSHPLQSHAEELKLYATDTTETLKDAKTSKEVALAGIVAHVRETVTKKGSRMCFLRLEDLKGSVEVVVFSDVYKESRDVIGSEQPLLVLGKLERQTRRGSSPNASSGETEECKILATEIMLLSEADKVRSKKIHITAPAGGCSTEAFMDIKRLLQEHPGHSPVFLRLVYPDSGEVVLGLSEKLKVNPATEVFEKIKSVVAGAEIKIV